MKKIIVATSNKHKLREIRRILKGIRVKGQGSRIKEDGKTFEENAIKKARSIKLKNDQIALADDSGLMVDCLDGKPGIKSARFASPPTPNNLCTKLIRVMRNADSWRAKSSQCANRRAKFVCAIAIVTPEGKTKVVKGIVHGKIVDELRGACGFGYDSVFIPRGHKKTFAEMKPYEKNKLSHRYKALLKVRKILNLKFETNSN